MIQINGKTHYTLEEAVEQTGYSKGTISSYIYQGIIDGEKMDDGTWTVSEAGMIALKRRKNIPVATGEKPVPDHVAEVNKSIQRIREGTIYLKTEEDRETYERVKTVCKKANVEIGDMTMIALRYYDIHVLSVKIQELEILEAKKKEILLGVTA